MNFQYLHRYPFIRLLFPLIAGFLVGNGLFFRGVCVSKGVLAGGLAGLFLLLLVVYFSHRYSLRWMFGCILYLFVFLGGAGGINSGFATDALFFFGTKMCLPGCSVGTTGAEGTLASFVLGIFGRKAGFSVHHAGKLKSFALYIEGFIVRRVT